MGSYNGTCGISQLPIREGDRIVVFPLIARGKSHVGGSSWVYSNDLFEPLTPPLLGTYDDYGGIQQVDQNEELVVSLFERLANDPQSPLRSNTKSRRYEDVRDGDGIRPPSTAEELVNTYLREPNYECTGAMMIHEDIYIALLEETRTRRTLFVENPLEERLRKDVDEFMVAHQKFLEKAPTIAADLKAAKQELNALPEDVSESDKKRVTRKWLDLFRIQQEIEYGSTDRYQDNEFVRFFMATENTTTAKRLAFRHFTESPLTKESTRAYVDWIVFSHAMNLLRKTWIPQAGGGSQLNELHLHTLVAKKIEEKAKAYQVEYLEENQLDDSFPLEDLLKDY